MSKFDLEGCFMQKITLVLLCFFTMVQAQDLYIYNNGKKVPLLPMQQGVSSDGKTLTVQLAQTGKKIAIQNKVVFKSKNEETLQKIKNDYNVTKFFGDVYMIELQTATQAIETANKLYEDDLVQYAEPLMKKEIRW
jgi:hypothetical protein